MYASRYIREDISDDYEWFFLFLPLCCQLLKMKNKYLIFCTESRPKPFDFYVPLRLVLYLFYVKFSFNGT